MSPLATTAREDARDRPRWGCVLVLILAGLFAAVAWWSVRGVNTQWDELNDHMACLGLLDHPLYGTGIDGSQARLPMYVTTAVYACVGPSVAVARAVSIAAGVCAIVLTCLAGRQWFGQPAGLLAAALLAASPYFIGLSRFALTEGDAFCPATVLLTMLAFERYLRRRDTRSVLLFGSAFGIAAAAKFYTVLLLPPLLLCDLLQSRLEPALDEERKLPPASDHRKVIGWVLVTLSLLLVAAAFAQIRIVAVAIILWALALALFAWGVTLYAARPSKSGTERRLWPALRAWFAILPLAAVVCMAMFPEHVIQPQVLRSFLRRLVRHDHVEPMAAFVDPARLYAGIILLKLGLPFGLITAASFVWAWLRSPRDPILRVLLAAVVMYVLLLTALPVRQTFYLMSVYPLIVLMLSAFIVHVARSLARRSHLRSAWMALAATCFAFLLWSNVRVYPVFNYFGYEIVGYRWLGAESRGYRNLVQVTNDGTEDALQWCADNVPPGRRVVSYLWDDHVIDAFMGRRYPAFELVRRLPSLDPRHGPVIEDADYLILGLNNVTSYLDAPTAEEMATWFEPVPVHTVWRGRDPYRMPVVRIYERRNRATRPASMPP